MKYELIGALGDVDNQRFVSALAGEVFVKPETQLAHMNANRAVLSGTVSGWLS
jgi:hypothetical protein